MDDPVEFRVEVKDERILTVPAVADEIDTEQIGKFLVNAGQDGYRIVSITPITRDYGNQRDPDVRTLGVKVRLTK
jgi:hypothetical protein